MRVAISKKKSFWRLHCRSLLYRRFDPAPISACSVLYGGIMNRFRGLPSASKRPGTVAPVLPRPLILPRLLACLLRFRRLCYNRFSARSEMLISRYYTFAE